MSLMSPVLGSSEDRIIDIMRYEDKLDDFIIGRYAAFDSTSSFHSALPLTHDSMLRTTLLSALRTNEVHGRRGRAICFLGALVR